MTPSSMRRRRSAAKSSWTWRKTLLTAGSSYVRRRVEEVDRTPQECAASKPELLVKLPDGAAVLPAFELAGALTRRRGVRTLDCRGGTMGRRPDRGVGVAAAPDLLDTCTLQACATTAT
jgi:hypothetical protein